MNNDEQVITIVRDNLYITSSKGFSKHGKHQTLVAKIEPEVIFENTIDVVKKITCVETSEEFAVPYMLEAKDFKNYVLGLIGARGGGVLIKAKPLD